MNSNKYLTHHKGVPLKAMNRDEALEVAQYYYRLYQTALDERQRLLERTGRAAFDVYEHREMSGSN